MNEVNNEQRNLDSWDEDELLFVTGEDIRYFFLDAFSLVLGRIVHVVFDFRSNSPGIQLCESV